MTKLFYLLLFVFSDPLFSQEITQNIRGTIKDKESQATLPGVIVSLLNNNQNTTTDENGTFTLEKVLVGRHTLKFSFIGYHEVIMPNIIVNSGKETILNIEMVETINNTEEVVITGAKNSEVNNDMASVSAKNFSAEEANRYAGSRGDPARMASNLAGVNGGDDSRNDIVIRGNSPAGVLWRVEGINIANPNHFSVPGTTGGPVCLFNSKTFGSSDFMTGAFPAEYGNSISGLFDIKFRNGNNQKHEFTGQVGVLGVEALAEGPLSKKTGATYIAAYRYSTLKLLAEVIPIGTSAVPGYQDLMFKINLPTKKAGNFSFFGVGGMSDVFVKLSDKSYKEIELYGDNNRDQLLKSAMGMLGFSHSKTIKERTFIKTTLAVNNNHTLVADDLFYRNMITDKVDTIFAKTRYTYNDMRYSLNSNVTHKFSAKTSLKFGIVGDYISWNFVDSNYIESAHVWDKRVNYKGGTFLIQPFAQLKFKPSDKLTFNIGLHAQHLTMNGSTSFEPRLGMRWNFSGTNFLNIGCGLHSQMQSSFIYFHQIKNASGGYEVANKNLDFTKSRQVVLGYEHSFKNASRIVIETYYQNLYNVPIDTFKSSYSALNQGSFFNLPYAGKLINKGTGSNYGIEFTFEKYFSKSYFFLFTTSLYKSSYKGSDGVLRSTDYDGRYILNALAGKEFKIGKGGNKVFSLAGKVTYQGGKRYSPADINASAAAGTLVEVDSLRNSLQFRDYFRFDLKLGYKVSTKKVTHEIAIDLVNLFGTKNLLALTYAPEPNKPNENPIKPQYQLGFLPLLYYKVDF